MRKRRPVPPRRPRYRLRLYVAGARPSSLQAIANIKAICEEHLRGRYTLDIVDLYQQSEWAEKEQLTAVPTLLKRLPAPARRLVGDLSDKARVLAELGILPTHEKR